MAKNPPTSPELIDARRAAKLIAEEDIILALAETAALAGDQGVQIHLIYAHNARELLDAHEVIADRMTSIDSPRSAEGHFNLAGRARQLLVHHLDSLDRQVCGG